MIGSVKRLSSQVAVCDNALPLPLCPLRLGPMAPILFLGSGGSLRLSTSRMTKGSNPANYLKPFFLFTSSFISHNQVCLHCHPLHPLHPLFSSSFLYYPITLLQFAIYRTLQPALPIVAPSSQHDTTSGNHVRNILFSGISQALRTLHPNILDCRLVSISHHVQAFIASASVLPATLLILLEAILPDLDPHSSGAA